MPTYFDIGVVSVVVFSALLATVRGFTREVMAIFSWGVAAAAAVYLYPFVVPKLAEVGSPIFLSKESLRPYVAGAAVFFVVLIVVSIITIRISDAILDSKVGALDRSLGFLFGGLRGLLLCAIAFIFLQWLAPDLASGEATAGPRKDWIAKSKVLPLLKSTSNQLLALLPDDPDGLLAKFKKPKPSASEDAPPPEADQEPKAAPATPSPPIRPKLDSAPKADSAPRSDSAPKSDNAPAVDDKHKLDSLLKSGR